MTKLTDAQLLAKVIAQLNSRHSVHNNFYIHGANDAYFGRSPSRKSTDGGPISYDSGLSKDALRLFEVASEVETIVAEPFVLEYELDGEIQRYRPDYLLYLRDGTRAVVEIKYQADADHPDNKKRFKAIRSLLERAGAIFAVLTEATLRTKTLRENLAAVESQRHLDVSDSTLRTIFECLCQGPRTMAALANAVGDHRIILAAIYQNHVSVNLCKPLLANTLIRGM